MSNAQHDPRPRRLRVLAEIGAITLGVFLGLAADAAWDSRTEHAREREYLAALLEEMREARAEFDTDQDARRIRLAGIESLQAEFDHPSAPADSIGAWALEARRVAVFYPPSAVFDDLVSSGNLRLIQSAAIRRALSEYQQNRPRLRFLEDREQIFIENEFRPYLVRTISFDGPQSSPIIARALADPVFRNLIEIRRFRIQATLDYSGLVSDAIDESIRLIEARLQRGAAP